MQRHVTQRLAKIADCLACGVRRVIGEQVAAQHVPVARKAYAGVEYAVVGDRDDQRLPQRVGYALAQLIVGLHRPFVEGGRVGGVGASPALVGARAAPVEGGGLVFVDDLLRIWRVERLGLRELLVEPGVADGRGVAAERCDPVDFRERCAPGALLQQACRVFGGRGCRWRGLAATVDPCRDVGAGSARSRRVEAQVGDQRVAAHAGQITGDGDGVGAREHAVAIDVELRDGAAEVRLGNEAVALGAQSLIECRAAQSERKSGGEQAVERELRLSRVRQQQHVAGDVVGAGYRLSRGRRRGEHGREAADEDSHQCAADGRWCGGSRRGGHETAPARGDEEDDAAQVYEVGMLLSCCLVSATSDAVRAVRRRALAPDRSAWCRRRGRTRSTSGRGNCARRRCRTPRCRERSAHRRPTSGGSAMAPLQRT